ncbi:hypothetical protein CHELA1G11_40094 [Hyphomicrobiales bacterium]|nr:hypothetical protein CHELA1G2_40046 [Hyphomicrobiales bacterium]CAH1696517.1 hypothetical protein CHELA1G11_40094 [Hyphomicrobiales bacterium]
MAESYEPGATVSEIARRHALSPQQLFGWRRLFQRAAEPASSPMFAPAAVDAVRSEPETVRQPATRCRCIVARPSAGIEIEIDGVWTPSYRYKSPARAQFLTFRHGASLRGCLFDAPCREPVGMGRV